MAQTDDVVEPRLATSRLAFGILGVVFVSLVVWAVGILQDDEIWPALIFPGFGRIPDAADNLELPGGRLAVFETRAGDTFTLDAEEAFVGSVDSFHFSMMQSLQDTTANPDLFDWANRQIADRIQPGDCLVALVIVEPLAADATTLTELNRIEFGLCEADAE